MNASKNFKLVLAKAGQGSAGTAINSDGINTEGYDGVMFFGTIATANAANFANLAQSSDDGSADEYTDLAGTKVVPGTNGYSFLIDVYKPTKKYVRCEIDRGGANTITGDIYALLYGAAKAPVTHGTTISAETHISPAEGTA